MNSQVPADVCLSVCLPFTTANGYMFCSAPYLSASRRFRSCSFICLGAVNVRISLRVIVYLPSLRDVIMLNCYHHRTLSCLAVNGDSSYRSVLCPIHTARKTRQDGPDCVVSGVAV